MTRYHPALVALHWLLAIAIIFSLIMGHFVLAETLNTDPEKIFKLKIHMGMGIAILLFMIFRLVVRRRTQHPPEADIGNATLNKLGSLTHVILYFAVIFMSLSGMGISFLSGLPEIVFFGTGGALPETFHNLLPHMVHEFLSKILALLIIGHVLAFLYHQFIRKDGLLSRMWFGKN